MSNKILKNIKLELIEQEKCSILKLENMHKFIGTIEEKCIMIEVEEAKIRNCEEILEFIEREEEKENNKNCWEDLAKAQSDFFTSVGKMFDK